MTGIIVELIISLLLLWFFEKQHLTVLGIGIHAKRMRDLGYGFGARRFAVWLIIC